MNLDMFTFVLGVLIFLLAIYVLRREWNMRKNGIRATGIVVDVQREKDSDNDTVYRPLVQFITREGQNILWRCTTAAGSWKNMTGRPMHIIYDPQNPQQVIRNHWTGYAAVVILFFLSGISLFVSFGLLPIW